MAGVASTASGSAGLPDVFLSAYYDTVAGLKVSSATLCLCDVAADGDFRLVAADLESRLRVYRGTSLSSTHTLLGEPSGLVAFYPDSSLPRTPSLAVSSGNAVYVYRHLRPYLKFTLPSLVVSPEELAVWETLKGGGASPVEAVLAGARRFGELRDAGVRLSSRAQDLLALPGAAERRELLESIKGKPQVQHTVVTCLGSINRSQVGPQEVSCLIVATEARQLLFLDAVGSSVTATVDLPSVATQLICWGVLEGEHRIYIAARDGVVYAVKDRVLMPTRVEPPALPVACARTGGALCVAGMDATLTAFAPKGTEVAWSRKLPGACTALLYLPLQRDRTVECLAVATEGGEVTLLGMGEGGAPVAAFRAPDTVVGMAFGRYGREGNTLVLALRSGGLLVKMLRRTATLEAPSALRGGSLPEVDTPLPIPKKTRLALDQGEREREAGEEMHRSLQRGLVKLRLSTAREYLKVLVRQGGAAAAAALEGGAAGPGGTPASQTSSSSSSSSSSAAAASGAQAPPPLPSLRVTCETLGLGPSFSLRVVVRNGGAVEASDCALVVACSSGEEEEQQQQQQQQQYYMPITLFPLPCSLLPGMVHVEDVPVECLDAEAPPGEVLVHIVQLGGAAAAGAPLPPSPGALALPTRALVTAVVAMPQSAPA
jgi:Bardet-Biedl syndrome 1 protein